MGEPVKVSIKKTCAFVWTGRDMLFFCAIGVLGRARGDLVMKKLRSPKFRYREDNSPIFYYNGCTVSSDKQCSIIAYIVD